jgi:arylsulfatase A-like enzyme
MDGLYEGEQTVQRPGYLTDLLADRAISELRESEKRRQPFLLSLHFTAPHWPWEGPGDKDVPATLGSLQHHDGGSLKTYAEMVTRLDAAIGRVLGALEQQGLARDTLVVFTSDNGGERFSDTWPFTGGKTELLEGGIRVPLLLRWPARLRAGGHPEQVMSSMDFLPTLLAAAGSAPDPQAPPDGENLLPVLTGERPVHPRKLYWRFKASAQAALRDGDWKYLRIGEYERLFDVAADPRERADLSERHPDVFRRLQADFAAWDKTMLPYPKESFSGSPKGSLADRY